MIRDRIEKLVRLKASSLRPHPQNWRKHPENQAQALRGVLNEIGFVDALLVRPVGDDQYEIVDGHLRAETSGDAEVPCLVCNLSDEEALKVLATFDPLAALAKSDAEKLDLILPKVSFDNEAVHKMLKDLARQAGASFGQPTAAIEDEVPEPPAEPVTQLGDIWICGDHKIICGDSTRATVVTELLGDAVPFLMVTDPPYGVDYDPEWRLNAGLNKEWQTRAEGTVENDGQVDWTPTYQLFPGHVAYVWHAGRYAGDVVSHLRAAGFEPRSQLIWAKKSLVISRGHYHWQHEPLWYAVRPGGSAKWCGDRKQSTIWDIPNMHRTQGNVDDGKTIHSTQKPVECMARPIRNHGGKDDAVYDPFLGSGTTLIACEQLGRRCFACELSPQYVDLSVTRWEKFTGRKAVRVPAVPLGTGSQP